MDKQLEKLYEIYREHQIISTDSRNCPKGAVYFALKGERFDGNQFVDEVLEKGAAWAVSDNDALSDNNRVIVVPDVLKSLQDLALLHRRKLGLPIIGITGTNGKTTTKELIAAVLSKKYKVSATKGNLNNHIGVPLTILSMNDSVDIGIVEMGANHIGEIAFLCKIAEPDYGVITNVGKAHLEGFGSFEGVKKTKGELYNYLEGNKGKVFLNSDNTHLLEMSKKMQNRLEYGSTSGRVKGSLLTNNSAFLSLIWGADGICQNERINTQLIGSYNLENVLCAISVGLEFKVSVADINQAISEYCPQNNRSQYIETESNIVILDAYNANPSSMQEALANFNKMRHDKKVVVLGGMKELGEDSAIEHERLIEKLKTLNLVCIYLVGREFKSFEHVQQGLFWYPDHTSLAEQFKVSPLFDSLILVKGSRSNQLEKIVAYL